MPHISFGYAYTVQSRSARPSACAITRYGERASRATGYRPAAPRGGTRPRRTGERALVAVIQEAWIQGVSTRKVDDLVQAMGMSGISKSQVLAL